MRNLLLSIFLGLSLILTFNQTQAENVNDQIQISILTCSPGQEIYSLFGHSAIRVQDKIRNQDLVFNYGIFNFRTPNFYMKFVRGKLKYNLGIDYYSDFKANYERSGQGMVEQELNLSEISKHKLLKALWKNGRPENRYYYYDFLYKNCSTLIRDIIKKEVVEDVQFYQASQKSDNSFRDLLNLRLNSSPWIYTGIHLVLGEPCDIIASNYQEMFLPEMLKFGFDKTAIAGNKIVQRENIVLKETIKTTSTAWYVHPLFIFGLLALIGLLFTLSSLKNKKRFILLDLLLFGLSSLLGFVFLFLWFFTDHQSMGPNWNLLWAMPIHLPLLRILFKKTTKTWVKTYFKYNSIFLLILIAAWPILPQSLPYTILPFVILLLVRSIYNAKRS